MGISRTDDGQNRQCIEKAGIEICVPVMYLGVFEPSRETQNLHLVHLHVKETGIHNRSCPGVLVLEVAIQFSYNQYHLRWMKWFDKQACHKK